MRPHNTTLTKLNSIQGNDNIRGQPAARQLQSASHTEQKILSNAFVPYSTIADFLDDSCGVISKERRSDIIPADIVQVR